MLNGLFFFIKVWSKVPLRYSESFIRIAEQKFWAYVSEFRSQGRMCTLNMACIKRGAYACMLFILHVLTTWYFFYNCLLHNGRGIWFPSLLPISWAYLLTRLMFT